jgi:hypothetical protein
MAPIPCPRGSDASTTTSTSRSDRFQRRSPGAPAAHKYGGRTASAVIGPVSARSTMENGLVGTVPARFPNRPHPTRPATATATAAPTTVARIFVTPGPR